MRNVKSSFLCILVLFFFIGQLFSPLALGADPLTVDTPNGGQNLKVGTVYAITWHHNLPYDPANIQMLGGSAIYKLEYSIDSGATYKPIAETDISDTSYNWTIPNTPTSKARVKVTLITTIKNLVTQQYDISTLGTDLSDGDFTISNSIFIPEKPFKPLPIVLAPATPSNLAATVISVNEIQLTWQDNSNNETQFKLERSTTTNSNYAEIAALAANTIAFTDNNVTPLTKYYYRVKAVNGSGSSAYSNEVTATTPPLAQPPKPSQPPQVSQQTIIKFYLGSTDFLVNEQLQTMDTSPVSIDGRTMLPIKYVAQPLGATTAWDPATQKVTVTLGSNVIELWVGNNTARVNGQDKLIDPTNPSVKPIILPPGRTMLPLRFIGENLGCQIDWNPTLQEAKLSYPKLI